MLLLLGMLMVLQRWLMLGVLRMLQMQGKLTQILGLGCRCWC